MLRYRRSFERVLFVLVLLLQCVYKVESNFDKQINNDRGKIALIGHYLLYPSLNNNNNNNTSK